MAISLPGDIVLDVARAADGKDVETARARLEAAIAARTVKIGFPQTDAAGGIRTEPAGSRRAEVPESFRKFEAMVLQTFVQNMLPEGGEAVYGEGLAGEMWKTFMAQEFAGAMAERGGVGIADRVLGDYYLSGEKRLPVRGVDGDPLATAVRDGQSLLSAAMVEEFQRTIVRGLDGGAETARDGEETDPGTDIGT